MTKGSSMNPVGARRKILVVEDNLINREMLRSILEGDFDVIEAVNGLEGLAQLERHHESISLVLLDVYMPECDGFEFLRRKRELDRFESVPVIVTTASDTREDEIRCLRLGANDFVVKPYNVEIMMNRINNTIHLRESASIVNQLMWDSLTGLYSHEFFYRRVDNLFALYPDKQFDMLCSDIENFKSLNDRYGRNACDSLLHDLAERLMEMLPGLRAGGRIGNDTYAFLIDHADDHEWTAMLEAAPKGLLGMTPTVKFGIVQNIDHKLSVSLTCDRAVMALEQVKGSFGTNIAWYNDELRQKQLTEQTIIETMEQALAEKQFSVHYQPKFDLRTNRTGGAEALARWIHPELGFISPGLFIPIFERNGFITKLDMYICEEACKQIKRCEELGLPSVPVSFNASRLDFDAVDLVDRIAALTDKYGVDRSKLHVELTETAYSDNPDRVIQALDELHAHGFLVELDDFGSGYSSLASLNVLPLDVMKLDMSIIRQAAMLDDFRIVHSAIQMAQFLNLSTVAEGVETSNEVETLRALGCDMIQGYYFSKPLCGEEFEAYLAREKEEQR